jgi:hypothetical protein
MNSIHYLIYERDVDTEKKVACEFSTLCCILTICIRFKIGNQLYKRMPRLNDSHLIVDSFLLLD